MQKSSAKTFSRNCFTHCHTHFWFLSGPHPSFHLRKNVWLGIYHYCNRSHCWIFFFFVSPQTHILSEVPYTVPGSVIPEAIILHKRWISTGNLHLTGPSVCSGNRNQTPDGAKGRFLFVYLHLLFFPPLQQLHGTMQSCISKQQTKNASSWIKRLWDRKCVLAVTLISGTIIRYYIELT